MKRCSKCGIEKPLTAFCKDRAQRTGLECNCKECKKAYRLKSKEQKKAYLKEYYSKPENVERRKANCKAHYYGGYKERRRTRHNAYQLSIQRGEKGELEQMKLKLRLSVYQVFRRGMSNKPTNTLKLLGAPWTEVIAHLGPKPTPDAHIDHICPIHQARTVDELRRLCHYWNLQWLPAKDNVVKRHHETPEAKELCLILLGRDWC